MYTLQSCASTGVLDQGLWGSIGTVGAIVVKARKGPRELYRIFCTLFALYLACSLPCLFVEPVERLDNLLLGNSLRQGETGHGLPVRLEYKCVGIFVSLPR